jgi:hypothetical protein
MQLPVVLLRCTCICIQANPNPISLLGNSAAASIYCLLLVGIVSC